MDSEYFQNKLIEFFDKKINDIKVKALDIRKVKKTKKENAENKD